MKDKGIKIAFFDIDGTLLQLGRKEPTPKTEYALNKLQENGVMICIATGRSVPAVPKFKNISFDVFLTFNGSLCFNRKETILSNPLRKEDVLQILENTKRMNRAISVSNASVMVKNGSHPDLDLYFEFGCVDVPIVDNVDELCQGDIYAINLPCRDSECGMILEGTTSTRATRWWDRAADLIPADGGKGKAIEGILKYYGLTREEAIAFGDGTNDIEMLQSVGTAVAMENANDAVKQAATHVCRSVDDDGIYYFCVEHGLI